MPVFLFVMFFGIGFFGALAAIFCGFLAIAFFVIAVSLYKSVLSCGFAIIFFGGLLRLFVTFLSFAWLIMNVIF